MAFSECRFCHGQGCLACEGERARAEQRRTERIKSFKPLNWTPEKVKEYWGLLGGPFTDEEARAVVAEANMPEPMFVARRDNPDDMEALKRIMGREVVEAAFGEGGGGLEEIMRLAEAERIKQGQRRA